MSQTRASSVACCRNQSPRARLRHASPTTPRSPPLEKHALFFCSLWAGSPTTGVHHPSNIAIAPLGNGGEERRRHRHLAERPARCPWKDHGAHCLAACEGPVNESHLISRIARDKHILTRNLNKDMLASSTALGMDFAKPLSPYIEVLFVTANYKRSSHVKVRNIPTI